MSASIALHKQGVTNCVSSGVALEAIHLNSTGALHPSEALSGIRCQHVDTCCKKRKDMNRNEIRKDYGFRLRFNGKPSGHMLQSMAFCSSVLCQLLSQDCHEANNFHGSACIISISSDLLTVLVSVSCKGQAEEVPDIILSKLLAEPSSTLTRIDAHLVSL